MFLRTFQWRNRQCRNRVLVHIWLALPPYSLVWVWWDAPVLVWDWERERKWRLTYLLFLSVLTKCLLTFFICLHYFTVTTNSYTTFQRQPLVYHYENYLVKKDLHIYSQVHLCIAINNIDRGFYPHITHSYDTSRSMDTVLWKCNL